MSDYYVNIDNDYSATYGDGTLSNPFNISQFIGHLTSSVSDDDNFYIKGYYSNIGAGSIVINLGPNSEPAISASNVSFKAWDLDLYGPWKIEGDLVLIQTNYAYMNYFSNFKISDFVFSNFKAHRNNNPENEPWYFVNGIFRDTTDFNSVVSSSPIYIQGCTLVGGITLDDSYMNEGYSPQSAGVYQFDDCVFYDAPLSDNYVKSITFNNCVFSGTSAYNLSALQTPTSAITISACTFDWVSLASLPSINAITPYNKGNLAFESFGLDYSFTKRRSYWQTLGMTSSFYQSKRRGPGAFYFTNNIFYVDLSSTSTTGTGISANPIGGVDFSANNGFYDNDNIRLRGSLILEGGNNQVNFCGSSGISMDAWDVSAYGPWKIVYEGNGTGGYYGFEYTSNLFLKNGILYVRDSSPELDPPPQFQVPALLLENMFIQIKNLYEGDNAPQLITSADGKRLTMKGSTLIMDTSATWALANTPSDNISLVARDCVFDIGSFCGPALSTSAILDNCVFDDALTKIKGSIFDMAKIKDTNCQYSWNPPSWPNLTMDVTKEQMAFSVLTSGTHNITISGSGQW